MTFIKWDRFSRNTAESYQMIGVFSRLYIQEGFEPMTTGIYNQKEVFNKLKAKGFKSSMTAIASIFRNHCITEVFL